MYPPLSAAISPIAWVHKSYIFALGHIRAIYGNSIELGKATTPIGINYKETVMNLVGKRP